MKYPQPFGRHLLLERISVGGMAEIFKAKSFGVEGFERVVAVKRILPTLAEDEEFTTMFIDEARIAAHLTHQNIVQIYELGKADETFFISMEYVAGRDVRAILDWYKMKRQPMDVPMACFIVSRVCDALDYAHRKKDPAGKDLKIIHRDVTPQNVIISYEGEVKLCDFGIAKAASRASRTQVGVLKGKFAYMSPEQVRGHPTDRRSDLFALGVIFYEMLTGERLFLGESDYSTLESVRSARVPPPTRFNKNIPGELEKILLRLLARDPKVRFQWASEVHEALLDHLVHNGKLYHGRHLRTFMQGVYAREIEVENAKLEEFMKLKLPEEDETENPTGPTPSPVVAALAEERPYEAMDPANIDTDIGARGKTDDLDYDEGEPEPPTEGPIPTLEGQSPVSNLFGAPRLDDDDNDLPEEDDIEPISEGNVEAMVLPAEVQEGRRTGRPGGMESEQQEGLEVGRYTQLLGDEEMDEDAERTQFDLNFPESGDPPDNDTVFDNDAAGEETLSEDGFHSEISAAQAELIQRLDEAGAMEDDKTIDAGQDDGPIFPPFVVDPSEQPPELLPDDEEFDQVHPGVIDEDVMNDATSISPLVPEEEGEDTSKEDEALAETAIRQEHEVGSGPKVGFLGPAPRVNGSGVNRQSDPNIARRKTTTNTSEVVRPTSRRNSGDASRPRRIREEAAFVEAVSEPSPPRATPSSNVHQNEVTGSRSPEGSTPSVLISTAAPLRDPRMLMVLASGVGLLAVALLVVVIWIVRPSQASLEIRTDPVKTVAVKIDGRLVSNATPVEVEGLEIGKHQIELIATGFRPHLQTIDILEAKPHTMIVPLEAMDGSEIPPPPPKDDPTPKEKVTPPEDTTPPPVEKKEPPPEKEDPLPAGDAPPEKKVENKPAKTKKRIADASPKSEIKTKKQPPKRKRKMGSLLVVTRPPGVLVLIDGKPTGKRTPIRRPLKLSVGSHEIIFKMDDGQTYSFNVDIEEGPPKKLLKRLR